MHLYLIRHGQSTNNLLYTTQDDAAGRSFDPELTVLGQLQAERLADYLCAQKSDFFHRITHLYCSPMLRAVDTGLPAAQALGLPLTAWKDLHEGGGLYLQDEETGECIGQPGPDRTTMAQRFPDLVWPSEMGDGPWWNRPTDEEPEERMPRARRVLAELLQRHPAESSDAVVFFTHAAFTNYFIAALLGLQEYRAPVWFSLYNTAITCCEFRPEREVRILFQNRTEHLPAEMITD
jgi:2,3-bisphosphoglycerate-dependent phosphoglycerate mutase